MSGVTLFAWAVPAFMDGSPVDHTWVTTYDNRTLPYPDDDEVVASGNHFWYCWGGFHAKGGTPDRADGFLGSQAGNLQQATCLVRPDANSLFVPSARGTIFTYGVDGVCHQLANQVLYATGTGGSGTRLTVHQARGYTLSVFFYGTYGLQHMAWQNKVKKCSAVSMRMKAEEGATTEAMSIDEFEQHLRNVLGKEKQEMVARLLALRDETHTQRMDVMMTQKSAAVSAESLNERNQHILAKAAELLGSEQFEKVFGVKPGVNVNLVVPEIFNTLNDTRS